MKRLLVFVFAVALLGSCSQQREYYFKFTVISNQSNLKLIQLIGGSGLCQFSDTSGVAVGSTCTTEPYTTAKGANISAGGYPHSNSLLPNATFDWEAEFYVNGNLEETRTGTQGLANYGYVNFIVP